MARTADGKNALIEVKAVDDAYPLYCELDERYGQSGLLWRSPSWCSSAALLLDRLGLLSEGTCHRRGERHDRWCPGSSRTGWPTGWLMGRSS